MSDKKFQKKLAKIQKQGERMKREYELKAMYEKYAPPKKEKKVSNIMLFIIVLAIVGYAVANFALQYFTSVEVSPTLTTAWFAFWGAEIISLAAIKTSKVKHKNENTEHLDITEDTYADNEAIE